MNTKLITTNVLTLSALAAVLLHGQGAGPLDPPAAPADGFYRTLEEIYDAVKTAETAVENATDDIEGAVANATDLINSATIGAVDRSVDPRTKRRCR
jgi:hypothetical protein